ncbi:MAG: hypothetical protein EBS55_09285, partial [Flavobacteriaceae bacterium]|nr:hypothetical protein [Flavobacteriaceae bacterium]
DNLKYPSDFHPIEHALETISFLRNSGAKIFIIFNEPSIAKKTVSIEDVDQVNNVLLEKLGQAGCMTIDGLYYSTSNFKEDLMSLPNTGMLKIAEQNSRISLKGGYVISDDIEHLKAAERFDMIPVLIKTGNWLKTEKKLNTFANKQLKKKTKVFNSLQEFREDIFSLGQ